MDNASDLIASAERVLKDNGFPNIAYHLAVLALEEIGKAGMIASRAIVGGKRDVEWMEKRLDDHVSKLQWALWSPRLGGKIDPKDFEEARRFAQRTHARRIAGIYASSEVDGATTLSPRLAVVGEQATSMIDLARARLTIHCCPPSTMYSIK